MHGYVAKRRDRYYAVSYEGRDPVTGKERRRWHPAGTDRAKAERLAATLAKAETAKIDAVRSLTFGAYLTRQWLPGKKLQLATSTYRGYERNAQLHVIPSLGRMGLPRPTFCRRPDAAHVGPMLPVVAASKYAPLPHQPRSSAVLAYDYPLMNVFLSILYFSLFFMWIWIAVTVVVDIFRSDDLGGVAKGFWFLFVVLAPFLGIFIYLIARGAKMHEHQLSHATAQQQAFNQHVQQVAGASDVPSQLEKLAALRDQGVLSAEEFDAQKAKLLS